MERQDKEELEEMGVKEEAEKEEKKRRAMILKQRAKLAKQLAELEDPDACEKI